MKRTQWIRRGWAYFGFGGEVRHVVMLHNCGRGKRVTWDSVSAQEQDYWDDLFTKQRSRPHGIMAYRDFQKWAIGATTANHPKA